MTIEQLRQLKHLSEIPTHSAESLEELEELVRMATIRAMLFEHDNDGSLHMCDYCEGKPECSEAYPNYNYCELEERFKLRMEDT